MLTFIMSKPHICAINWEILGNIRQFAIIFAYLNLMLTYISYWYTSK